MWWRLGNAEFERNKGEANKKLLRGLVEQGQAVGMLAYESGKAVGWCSVAPRDDFPRLDRSRTMKRLDTKPVWSLVCLFIDKNHRRKGLSSELVRAASAFAAQCGAEIVEAYPRVLREGKSPDVFIYTGLPQIFEKAGFHTVAEPTGSRWIMRLDTAGRGN